MRSLTLSRTHDSVAETNMYSMERVKDQDVTWFVDVALVVLVIVLVVIIVFV